MNSRPASAYPPARVRREDPRLVLERLELDVQAARAALARGRVAAIEHLARGLLSTLRGLRVRVELAYASAAFAEGLDLRPDAEEWVFVAVSARATLERAVKSGAAILSSELEELDAAFEDAREGVLLLEPEDYKEALAGTPPKPQAWWGERARVDARVREIDLERALGVLATD